MKVTGAKAKIADNITDGFVTQFEIDDTQIAMVVYKITTKNITKTEMILISFAIYDERKPQLFVLGLYTDYDILVGTDLHSTKVLNFDQDPLTAKNYMLFTDRSIKWSLLYTEPASLKF
jgi:Zinc finger, C3HC4 type (RING finger)